MVAIISEKMRRKVSSGVVSFDERVILEKISFDGKLIVSKVSQKKFVKMQNKMKF